MNKFQKTPPWYVSDLEGRNDRRARVDRLIRHHRAFSLRSADTVADVCAIFEKVIEQACREGRWSDEILTELERQKMHAEQRRDDI